MGPGDVSIIVPVYNGGVPFMRCMDAIAAADPAPLEVIIVDDGSVDVSRHEAVARNMRVVTSDQPRGGPGAARNLGAHNARGEILFFVDSDVLIRRDTVARVARAFDNPKVDAIFGSYDDAPGSPDLTSQYKNLLHHYVHQKARADTTSFWAGCGAIRRTVFQDLGGFDPDFDRPSIEDIELGYRLREAGYHTRLVKDLQVKHLKAWGLRAMLKSDIKDRALPWAELMLRRGEIPADLNLGISHRISAALALLLLPVATLAIVVPSLSLMSWLALALIVVGLLGLNLDLYLFFLRKRDLFFVAAVIPLHWAYYIYSSLALLWVFIKISFGSLAVIRSLRRMPTFAGDPRRRAEDRPPIAE